MSVHAFGMNFYPDVGISLFGQQLVAVEVKFLRGHQRQNSVATALGQALLYRTQAAYQNSVVLLVDVEAKLTTEEVSWSTDLVQEAAGIPVVVRRRSGTHLLLHDENRRCGEV